MDARRDDRSVSSWRRAIRPASAVVVILAVMVVFLRLQGRVWVCACGSWAPWAGDIWSAHNSQHLFDPYSFTHILHGVLFYGILALTASRLPVRWRLVAALFIETVWEVVENSPYIIQRYREATIGLGYEGDSIVNSIADVVCCAAGFWLARRLGWRWSIVLFLAIELILLFWVRDNLTLNILMLTFPIEAVKQWQMEPAGVSGLPPLLESVAPP